MAADDLQISFTLKVSDDDASVLRTAIGLKPEADIRPFLSAVARGATEMVVPELLGRAEYPTKTVARQTRLLKLVQHAFRDEMPSSSVVAALFHLTPSAASALVTATGARFAPELKRAREASAKATMQSNLKLSASAEYPVNYRYQFACSDAGAVTFIRELLNTSSDGITNLVKSRDTANVYEIDGTALRFLAARWRMEVRDFVLPTDLEKWDKNIAKALKGGKGTP